MPHLSYGIKLHAGSLHHENAQMTVHEVFVHPFRLPRRGEEMAHFLFLLCFCIAKKSLFPEGNKDRKYNFCGTTLFAGKPTARPTPTRRLPNNAGNASEDTLVTHFPLPSAAHLLPRFSLPSQLWETLCGCACSFTSASVVCCFEVVFFIHQVKLFVKNFFQNFSRSCGQMFSADVQYSRTTPLTTPMIWA